MKPLVFGTIPSAGSSRGALREHLCWLLTGAIGRDVHAVVADSYGDLLARIGDGEIEIAWLPPVLYVKAEETLFVRLLVAGVRAHAAHFHGALFTRKDSGILTLEDLRNKRIAWVDRLSAAGYVFPRLALRQRGLGPEALGASEIFAGSHAAVVEAVTRGDADAGATFVNFAAAPLGVPARIANAGWLALRSAVPMEMILSAGPIPSDVIVTAQSVDDATADKLSDVLMRLHLHARGAKMLKSFFGVEWLEPALPARYDAVRKAIEQ